MSRPCPAAEFHDIAKRVNNWGRWGADDEIGTLNLITDEVVREAAADRPHRPPRSRSRSRSSRTASRPG